MRQPQISPEQDDAPAIRFRAEGHGGTYFVGHSSEEIDHVHISVYKASNEDEEPWWGSPSGTWIQDTFLWRRTPTDDANAFPASAPFLPIYPGAPSNTLLPEQQLQCEQALQDLVNTAGEPNWDEEGADPVTKEIVEIAQRVIKELPGDIEPPQIAADPEGNIEFDWYLENGTMFTISVGKEGDIALSGLHQEREERLSAIEKDSQDPLPQLLSYGVQWLRKMKDR